MKTAAAKTVLGKRRRAVVPTPPRALARIQAAAVKDLTISQLVLALFETILGREKQPLFPHSSGGLIEFHRFPSRLQKDVRAIVDWALGPAPHEVIEIYRASLKISSAVVRMRRDSILGRRLRRRANRLMLLYPPLEISKWTTTTTVFDILQDEVGRPLSERTIQLVQAFNPQKLQIVRHGHPLNSTWSTGILTVRLDQDEYRVKGITIALDALERSVAHPTKRIEGELIDFFETGTEGVIWMLDNESRCGRGALEPICEGDYLTILDQMGVLLWRGVIHCDKKTGWRPYPMNPQYGQQCALGHWVHWIQKGFNPDDWAKFFIRRDDDRLRGILTKRLRRNRNPQLGPKLPEG